MNIDELPRRERQVFDAVYQLKEATAADVLASLADRPSYSAVRAMLSRLESKGALKHRVDGQRYLYSIVVTRRKPRESALQHVVQTFFDGSPARAASALLGMWNGKISAEELRELEELVAKAKKEAR
jgi:BlaI family penicillinase repressor